MNWEGYAQTARLSEKLSYCWQRPIATEKCRGPVVKYGTDIQHSQAKITQLQSPNILCHLRVM